MTNKIIIEGFIKKHGDKYDYSKVNFINYKSKVEIICKKHGSFFQLPYNHKIGQKCPLCDSRRKKDIDYFIENSNIKHNNKYDYSLVIPEYKNITDFYKIICPEHGVFIQKGTEHLKFGCNECAKKIRPISATYSNEMFIEKANEVHNNRYDYSRVEYLRSDYKVEIICKKHGSFFQQPQSHLLGTGCPKCKMSNGEFNIKSILEEQNIEYIYNSYNKYCKNPKTNHGLYFDFYLPKYNTYIEVDGNQHYVKHSFWDKYESFEDRKFRDDIKDEWILNNNGVKMIRICPEKIMKVDILNIIREKEFKILKMY